MTMIMVEIVVVPRDKAYAVTSAARQILNGIQTGTTARTKYTMLIAENPRQHTSNLEHIDQPMEATFKMSRITTALQQ